MNRDIAIAAFAIFVVLWLAFGVALIFNPSILDSVWQAFRGWPLIIQIVVGLLLLPVTLGLWVWESSWPLVLRLVVVIGLALATLVVFFPRPRKA
jgi:hypothetical protein